MRCDKCGKKFTNDWMPDTHYPKYDITERKGTLYHISSIYLCEECSQKLSKWLEEKENDKQ